MSVEAIIAEIENAALQKVKEIEARTTLEAQALREQLAQLEKEYSETFAQKIIREKKRAEERVSFASFRACEEMSAKLGFRAKQFVIKATLSNLLSLPETIQKEILEGELSKLPSIEGVLRPARPHVKILSNLCKNFPKFALGTADDSENEGGFVFIAGNHMIDGRWSLLVNDVVNKNEGAIRKVLWGSHTKSSPSTLS